MHVAEVPGVIRLADAGRPGLRRRLRLEPGDEGLGRPARRGDRRAELRRVRRHLQLEIGEALHLGAHRAGAGDPEVARVAGQIPPRLLEQRRNRPELAREPALVLRREREGVGPEVDDAVRRRPFVRRGVARLLPNRGVVGRIAHPRLQYPHVEVEAVHLGAHELEVDLLLDRPPGRVDRREPRTIARELRMPPRHRRRREVVRPVTQRRLLERPPVVEEREQRRVAGDRGGLRDPRPGAPLARRDQHREPSQRDCKDRPAHSAANSHRLS